MYIEAVPNRNSPPAILLRESYRVDGKVKKRTLLNLSDWPPDLIEGFRTLLKGGTALPPGQDAIVIKRSLPHGHVAAVLGTLRRIGLDRLLGPTGAKPFVTGPRMATGAGAGDTRPHLTRRDLDADTLEDMFDFERSPSLNTAVGIALPPTNDCTPAP